MGPTDVETRLFAGDTELAALMRAKDWSQTEVGPPATWPQSLRTAVRIMLTSRFAMWMGWGPDAAFFYNDAYRPTLGLKHPQALGMAPSTVWAEIWPAIGPRIETVIRTGQATWDEDLQLFLYRNGYSEETYHTFSYSPLPDDDGITRGHLCVVSEETERVIAERRLALLRTLAVELAAATLTTEIAKAVEQSLRTDAHDIPFSVMVLAGDEKASFAWRVDEVMATGQPVVVELDPAVSWPRGPWAVPPTRAYVMPIGQRGGDRPAGVFVAGINPHRALDDAYRNFLGLFVGQLEAGLANAAAYEQERRRAEALAEVDRAKTMFFSNVSHEFRTPLTLMLGPLEELVSDLDVPDAQREQLALVQKNGQRLLKLVNTLLEFARIEAGRVQARYEPVDLAQQTADLASVFRAATDKAGLALRVDCPPLGELVPVDRDMWEKIVLNLLSNAFKFTFQGEISVILRRHGDEVELTVSDTGTGIGLDDLPHVFERFHRVEGARGRSHEGTGIGLALVAELVRLHGGTVSVESVVDRGTTFRVRLPLASAHTGTSEVAAVRRATVANHSFVTEALGWIPDTGRGVAKAESSQPLLKRERIVIADDNRDLRDYIVRLLDARWEVEAVTNGREALAAIRTQVPDLVITDVMMPELDGFGLVEALRADPDTRELPVLMLSARAGEESRVEGLERGASDYLVKPFSARELVARVESLLLRERIRAASEAQAKRMEMVFHQAPMPIAITRGPMHVIELSNAANQRLLGHRAVQGKPFREAFPEIAEQAVAERLDRIWEGGERFAGRAVEIHLRNETTGEIERRFFDTVYQPMYDERGKIEGIALVSFEVTDLAQAREAAEVASRAKDEFMAMLGHELRNPLAPILTAVQLLRLGGEEHVARASNVIERQVTHMVGLVDDLLDVSRITQGKVQLKRERIELAHAVTAAIEIASPLLERHHHQLSVDVPTGLLVDVDPGRWAQVIANLLTNAAKYSPPHSQITVTARASEDTVTLRVRDTGIGIEASVLPHIFEPFTQERQAIDRSQGGLGLGLAIVSSLVKLHGGQVSVASEGRDRGTELEIQIARATTPSAVRSNTSQMPAAAGLGRILVVDDNEDAAVMIAESLSLFGYETRYAHDGPSALRSAEEFQPDFAILDIGLPVMDGFELARAFGEHPVLERTRLIALTGYGQASDRERSAAAGFSAHLVKPVNLQALRQALATLSS